MVEFVIVSKIVRKKKRLNKVIDILENWFMLVHSHTY